MTAIEACVNNESIKKASSNKQKLGVAASATIQKTTTNSGSSSNKYNNDTNKKRWTTTKVMNTRAASSVPRAKKRFTESVSRGIEEMVKEGFSRDHATAMMLNELRQGGPRPDDKEVLKVVKSRGLGFDEALTALTVAAALHRVRTEHKDLSTWEAIDELTYSISVHRLMKEGDRNHLNQPSTPQADSSMTISQFESAGKAMKSRSQKRRVSKVQAKHVKKSNSLASGGSKGASRRRALEDISKPIQETDAKAGIELVAKSLFSLDESKKESNPVRSPKLRKRSNVSALEDESIQLQPPLKRAKL